MRNDSYTGWLGNPQNLEIGDEIYNPVLDEWIEIPSLNYYDGNYKVYDILTTNNNFIGNGILLDPKF